MVTLLGSGETNPFEEAWLPFIDICGQHRIIDEHVYTRLTL